MDSLATPEGLELFRATNREECGILVKSGEKIRIVRVENVATRDDDYAILMKDYIDVVDGLEPGDSIVGFFHTHLPHHDCEPTDEDFDGAALFPEFNNLIYKPDTKEKVWYGAPDEVGD